MNSERLRVVLAEYTALRAELMFFMNSIQVSHQFTWTLILAEMSALVYMDKLDHWLLFLAYLFGAPLLVLLLLLRSAANRASLLLVAEYIHKGIKRQIESSLNSLHEYPLGVGIFEWEEHKARSNRVERKLLKVLDISPWGVFYVAFVISLILGLYVGKQNGFFGQNPNYLSTLGAILCLFGIALTSFFSWKYNVIDSEARQSRSASMVREKNYFRYAVQSIDTAKSIILTPEGTTTTDERWANETTGILEIILGHIPPESCVLDFGMGIGRVLRALSEKRSDLRMVGIESSPDMRRLAHKYLGSSRSYDIRTDMSGVRFESVDFAYALYVLQHVSGYSLDATIDDLYKALKPGGTLFIIDNKRRVVPVEVLFERSARQEGLAFVDHAILKIAKNEHGDEEAWKNDGISVIDLLKKRFGKDPQFIEPNPKWFCDAVRANHHFAFFRK
jgi:Methylase involved in ubiquinone/menaquinone biosynthesis